MTTGPPILYKAPNFTDHGLGVLSESSDMQLAMKAGARSKKVRSEAVRLQKGFADRVEPYLRLSRPSQERLNKLLVAVAHEHLTNAGTNRPLEGAGKQSATELAQSLDALAVTVARDLRRSGNVSPTPVELEAAIKERCQYSIPPFCYL